MSENYTSFLSLLVPHTLREKRQAVMLLDFRKLYASTVITTCGVDIEKSFAVFVIKAIFNEAFAGTK